jgi:hypothetical protein
MNTTPRLIFRARVPRKISAGFLLELRRGA